MSQRRQIIRPNRQQHERDPPEEAIQEVFTALNKAWEMYTQSSVPEEKNLACAEIGRCILWLSEYKIYTSYDADRPHLEWWSRNP
jgi:hypothetical protein